MGGAQGINLLIGLFRTKLVAILLGPAGVGLVGLYQSAVGLVGTFAGLGIASSGVRQVAGAHGSGNAERVGITIRVLRRTCWFTGLLGTLLAAVLAWPLSVWTFGSPVHAGAIALVGITILINNISSGQKVLVQGVRRIGDLARLQVLSAATGTVVGVGLYACLRQRGIVPALLASAAINLGFSWWFARRVFVPPSAIPTWRQTFLEVRDLVGLGLAFMTSGLLGAGTALLTRAWIQRSHGLEANGIYQAAWGISGVFAGFILQAMGADFYPRLTAISRDHPAVNRLVNEQTEIGILLALPGLVATLAFSGWIVRLLYSDKFLSAAELLPWFVLGIFGRVLSWPIGYILLAKGSARWYAASEILAAVVQVGLIWVGLRYLGLKGVAMAYVGLYSIYLVGMLLIGRYLTAFRWSAAVVKLCALSGLAIGLVFLVARFAPAQWGLAIGALGTILSGLFSARQIVRRLGPGHRLSRFAANLPLLGPALIRLP